MSQSIQNSQFYQTHLSIGLFKFVVTNRGTLNLILHQHLYRPKYLAQNGQRVWVCAQTEEHCAAKCYSINGKLVSKKGMHNHSPPRDLLMRKEATGQIRWQQLF